MSAKVIQDLYRIRESSNKGLYMGKTNDSIFSHEGTQVVTKEFELSDLVRISVQRIELNPLFMYQDICNKFSNVSNHGKIANAYLEKELSEDELQKDVPEGIEILDEPFEITFYRIPDKYLNKDKERTFSKIIKQITKLLPYGRRIGNI